MSAHRCPVVGLNCSPVRLRSNSWSYALRELGIEPEGQKKVQVARKQARSLRSAHRPLALVRQQGQGCGAIQSRCGDATRLAGCDAANNRILDRVCNLKPLNWGQKVLDRSRTYLPPISMYLRRHTTFKERSNTYCDKSSLPPRYIIKLPLR